MDAKQADNAKTQCGSVAMFLWVAFGIYFWYVTPSARLVSWQTPTYFIAGSFAAALVLGAIAYYSRYISAAVIAITSNNVVALVWSPIVHAAFDLVVPYVVAKWAVAALH